MNSIGHLKVGNKVKLISRFHGDAAYNPVWNGNHGRVKGKIVSIEHSEDWDSCDTEYPNISVYVDWENNESNTYMVENLAVLPDRKGSDKFSRLLDDIVEELL